MCILSASAVHGGAIRCVVWNVFHMAHFILHVSGEATLDMGPYRSTGVCHINYTLPEINVVVMAKALFDCSSQCQPCITIRAASQLTA